MVYNLLLGLAQWPGSLLLFENRELSGRANRSLGLYPQLPAIPLLVDDHRGRSREKHIAVDRRLEKRGVVHGSEGILRAVRPTLSLLAV